MEYIFYKIECCDKTITDFYIGSTKNYVRRKSEHRSRCNNENCNAYKYKIYSVIRNNGGWDNWEINPIDKLICATKLDAIIYERQLIDKYTPTLNIYRPYITEQERKIRDKEYTKKWRNDNRDKFNQYQRDYRATKKDQQLESDSLNSSSES